MLKFGTTIIGAMSMTAVMAADLVTTDSGLQYEEITVGEGKTPNNGETVVVHYTGWLKKG